MVFNRNKIELLNIIKLVNCIRPASSRFFIWNACVKIITVLIFYFLPLAVIITWRPDSQDVGHLFKSCATKPDQMTIRRKRRNVSLSQQPESIDLSNICLITAYPPG